MSGRWPQPLADDGRHRGVAVDLLQLDLPAGHEAEQQHQPLAEHVPEPPHDRDRDGGDQQGRGQ